MRTSAAPPLHSFFRRPFLAALPLLLLGCQSPLAQEARGGAPASADPALSPVPASVALVDAQTGAGVPPPTDIPRAPQAASKPAPSAAAKAAKAAPRKPAFTDRPASQTNAFGVNNRTHDESGRPLVAISFDDGPWPKSTEQILKMNEELQVPLTFFVIGKHVEQWGSLLKAEHAAGAEIGSHTWSHPAHQMSAEAARQEIKKTDAAIEALGLPKPRLFRPPSGMLHTGTADAARADGEYITLWNVDPLDWKTPVTSDQIVERVLKQVKPGSIILMHDGGGRRQASVNAFPRIVKALREKGYQFVPVADILDADTLKPASP